MRDEEQLRLFNRLVQEMRRGSLVLAVLALLPERKYGYELLKEMNDLGFNLSQDTLYPLLRRLDEQKLLESEWVVDGNRPRKYYSINIDGKTLLENLSKEWMSQSDRLREVIK
jgi:DNA-binding PadR family transcriptional regulator